LADTKSTKDFQTFSHDILDYVNKGVPKIDFIRDILTMLLDFSGCDAVEFLIEEQAKNIKCKLTRQRETPFQYNVINITDKKDNKLNYKFQNQSVVKRIHMTIIKKQLEPNLAKYNFNANGSFWTGNIKEAFKTIHISEKDDKNIWYIEKDYSSLAQIPLFFFSDIIGSMQLLSKQGDYFTDDEIGQYEYLAHNLGIALVNQKTQSELRERVKELTCLYSIARVSERQDLSLEEILQSIVELLPQAWQYPESTAGSIELDGHIFLAAEFKANGQKQIADIIINRRWRGAVEIVYLDEKPELDEGPFLREERKLIDAIARQIAFIVEQKEAEQNKLKLQEQIRHADRLATIGQLGAGVAHELNEPLGNILGFAQLIMKYPGLPETVNQDLDKIINATLNAREVIKKLLLFARQMPHKKDKINLNKIIRDGLYFFEARCSKEGIELVRVLSPNLQLIIGDPAQLNQVIVNLVVNAIQAMPDGGKLIIKTYADNDSVYLVIEDNGKGMSKDVIKKIFEPFFTTKDIDEGTGLGLAVVLGIITSHKGRIKVGSAPGIGTRFEIKLPIEKIINDQGEIVD
jgi:two-component system NtrC family sensor kinase